MKKISKAQLERDKQAIRRVLEAAHPLQQATSMEISLRGGENLFAVLRYMIASGELVHYQAHSHAPIYYRLAPPQ